MKFARRNIFAIVLACLWINASEFFRNQILLPKHWAAHYQALGIAFPSAPINGLVWVIWGFIFAGVVYAISRRFGLMATFLLCWTFAFPMMWLVIWNLNVLPISILVYAIPLSLLEAFVAALICNRLSGQKRGIAT